MNHSDSPSTAVKRDPISSRRDLAHSTTPPAIGAASLGTATATLPAGASTSATPSHQTAAFLIQPEMIELRHVPVPTPGPGEVVVKIIAATTCGTDVKMFRRGHPLFPFPFAFGHEFSGIVTAIGAGVEPFREGDAVMAVHSAPCGECHYCRRRLPNLCDKLLPTMSLGAYSQYLKLSANQVRQNVYMKPEHLSFAEASLLEPLSCAVYGLRQLDMRLQEDEPPVVLLYGAGPLSLLFVRLLGRQQARVVVCARKASAREMALRLGASAVAEPGNVSEVLRRMNHGYLADIAIDCTGQPSVWEECVELVDKGGQVLFFGGCPGGTKIQLDTRRVHYDQIALHGVFHFDPTAVTEAVRLLCEGHIDVKPLLTSRHALTDVPAVFRKLAGGDNDIIKAVIEP